jgi:hypothetical protein
LRGVRAGRDPAGLPSNRRSSIRRRATLTCRTSTFTLSPSEKIFPLRRIRIARASLPA